MNNTVDSNHIRNFITEAGLLSEKKIKKIENTVFEKNIDFLDALVENNFLDQQTLSEVSASIMGVPRVNLDEKIITLETYKNIPELISQAHNLICFEQDKNSISIAFCQTKDLEVLEKYIPENSELKLFLANRDAVAQKAQMYTELNNEENFFKTERSLGKITTMDTFGVRSEDDLPRHFRNDIASDLYTEKFINGIVEYAANAHADYIFFNLSDENDIEVSLRIASRNYPLMNIGHNVMFAIAASIKKKADINIFEKFVIKQGSYKQTVLGQDCTVFTTFTQTDFGESITLQITKNKKFKTDIAMLSKKQRNMLLPAQKKDSGFFILSGEKESGKSTSLYSFLEFDVAKHKDIYTLEHTVQHNLAYTKQISLPEKTNTLPIITKITQNHPDVIAVEKISKALLPTLFNYVSTSKKVFFSNTKQISTFIDTLIEMDFDKGQMVKNFALFIEHKKFKALDAENKKQYFLSKEDIKTLTVFISEKHIQQLFAEESLTQQSKNKLTKIPFYTQKSTKTKKLFSKKTVAEDIVSEDIYFRGVINLGLFLENAFLKRFGREKIKNALRKEIKKSVLENTLIGAHRGQIDIQEVIKYLTK